MSIELHIFLEKSQVPTRDDWQREITRLGFPLAIEAPFEPHRDRGFRPAIYRGAQTGFEFYLEPSAEILTSYPKLIPHVGDRDLCATFRWGSDLTEMSAALAAAASLAKLADGMYYYPNDGIGLGADEALRAIRKDLGLM